MVVVDCFFRISFIFSQLCLRCQKKKKNFRHEPKMPKDGVWKTALKHKSNHVIPLCKILERPMAIKDDEVGRSPHRLGPEALHHLAPAPTVSLLVTNSPGKLPQDRSICLGAGLTSQDTTGSLSPSIQPLLKRYLTEAFSTPTSNRAHPATNSSPLTPLLGFICLL